MDYARAILELRVLGKRLWDDSDDFDAFRLKHPEACFKYNDVLRVLDKLTIEVDDWVEDLKGEVD